LNRTKCSGSSKNGHSDAGDSRRPSAVQHVRRWTVFFFILLLLLLLLNTSVSD